jgi:hypothetical protein
VGDQRWLYHTKSSGLPRWVRVPNSAGRLQRAEYLFAGFKQHLARGRLTFNRRMSQILPSILSIRDLSVISTICFAVSPAGFFPFHDFRSIFSIRAGISWNAMVDKKPL